MTLEALAAVIVGTTVVPGADVIEDRLETAPEGTVLEEFLEVELMAVIALIVSVSAAVIVLLA
jgi:hypothetical protein